MKAIVYRISNRNNGKSYIGMTIRTLEQRWKSHLSAARQGSKFRFHAAIRKYGVDAWDKEVIRQCDDVLSARKAEEMLITEEQTTKVGYNAKPGGCGGWIVPEAKYADWRDRISNSVTGSRNPNALVVTNDQLIEIGLRCIEANGFIPGLVVIRRFSEANGVIFPKHFTNYRFGGGPGYIEVLKQISGKEYKPYVKSEECISRISAANTGKRWCHNDILQKTSQRLESELADGWILGRKKYD